MRFATTSVGDDVCILAANTYRAIPIRLQNSSNVYKAGTPVTIDGAAALDGTNAIGILLYDVNTAINPNGAAVVDGIIDYAKIVANAVVTATASTLHSAIPGVFFRENIKVTPVLTLSAYTAAVTAAAGATHTASVTVTNAVGTVTVASSAATKATATVSSGTITITGVASGTATITVADAIGQTAAIAVTVS